MKTLVLLLAVLVCQQESQQSLDPAIAKWEDAIVKLQQQQESETVENGIVYYGSSSIRRWNSLADDMAPWPAIQRGYGGAKLPDISHYAPRILGPHLGQQNSRRCRAIVLFVGNDISGNKEADASPEEVGARFSRLHRWIRQQDPTLPVFWIEVTPTNRRWAVWPEIQAATQQVRSVLDRDPYAYFIPTAGAYLGRDGKPRAELFVEDQLHLNEAGYQLWSALIKTQLFLRLGDAVPQTAAAAKN